MSVGDILAVVTILIKVGTDLYNRMESVKQAADDLLLLTVHLQILSKLFEGSEKDIIMANSSEFIKMLGILKSIQESYNKCAMVLGVESAGTKTATPKTAIYGKSFTKRVAIFARIPSILADIRYKAEQLQKISSILSVSFLSDVQKHQRKASAKESINFSIAKNTTLQNNLPDLYLSTGFTSIDRMIENLMNECKHLEYQLQECTLFPDTSAVQDYQAQNPEGASFWRDRFQKGKLYASALRYEVKTRLTSLIFFSLTHLAHHTDNRFFNRHYTFLGHASFMR